MFRRFIRFVRFLRIAVAYARNGHIFFIEASNGHVFPRYVSFRIQAPEKVDPTRERNVNNYSTSITRTRAHTDARKVPVVRVAFGARVSVDVGRHCAFSKRIVASVDLEGKAIARGA